MKLKKPGDRFHEELIIYVWLKESVDITCSKKLSG